MLRIIFASVIVLAVTAGCASASASFQPTPYLPTVGPTPQGMAVATAVPTPTNTAVPTAAPTEAPTTAGGTPEATDTAVPTATLTVVPRTIIVQVTDSSLQPNPITVTNGQYVRIVFNNIGSGEMELVTQDLKTDNVLPDESLSAQPSPDQLDQISGDADKGIVHLFAVPQGSAAASFTPKQIGTFPFTITISGHQLSGSIVVQ